MFSNHFINNKYKKTLTLRQNTLAMFKKGNVTAQSTVAAINYSKEA